MDSKISRSILGGVVGTVLMTMIIFVAPTMGMPKMSPPDMLAGMMGMPIMFGWIMHFMIGIIFALAYTFLFAPKVKISSICLKGAIFGFVAFIFAQIAMAMMGVMFSMPKPEGSMILMMIGSIMGHILFGIGVSQTVGKATHRKTLYKQAS